MRFHCAVRNHPVVLLGVIAVGFGTWVASDATAPRNPGPLPEAFAPREPLVMRAVAPPPVPPGTDVPAVAASTRVVTASMVPRLHPGMSRVEVEGLIGPPEAGMIHPVRNVNGRLTYRATYPAELAGPVPAGAPVSRSLIGLEFDASAPGHPLVQVHLTAPTS